jgi:hypothetical protein
VRKCGCGATPELARGREAGVVVLQVRCGCGLKGARLICWTRAQYPRAAQAAVDGWNLAT